VFNGDSRHDLIIANMYAFKAYSDQSARGDALASARIVPAYSMVSKK
jgi:hypothetical protein